MMANVWHCSPAVCVLYSFAFYDQLNAVRPAENGRAAGEEDSRGGLALIVYREASFSIQQSGRGDNHQADLLPRQDLQLLPDLLLPTSVLQPHLVSDR